MRITLIGVGLVAVCAAVLEACGGGGGGGGSSVPANPPAPPPSNLSYPSPQSLTVGASVTLSPTVSGSVASFAVSPALPAGMSLNTTTGVISGSPTAAAAQDSYAVVAQNASGSTSFALQLAVTITRATSNRPDEQTGYQLQIVYVLPSDGADANLDTDGRLARSVASWNLWLRGQTNGRSIRLDTFAGGNPDIQFLRLRRTDAQIKAFDSFVREQIEYEMLAAGFDDPQKTYLAYYGGGSTYSCGGAAYPPLIHGHVTAIYLNGTPPGAPACNSNQLTLNANAPGYYEFAAIHDLLHTLGFVASCARNHLDNGHVSDSPTDLMYIGPQPWRPSVLDINKDDYFETGIAGCLDLASSALLDPLPAGATPPPGWPYLNLEARACSLEGSVQSLGTGGLVSIEFVNGRTTSVEVHRLGPTGTRQLVRALGPGEGFSSATRVGDSWLASGGSACLGIFSAGARHGRAVLR